MAASDIVSDRVLGAAKSWYEGKRAKTGNVHTNIMCVGIAVAELLKSSFPLTEDIVRSEGKTQVRGLSGSLVSRVLKEHGETQEFTSEGGRTSRGTLPAAQEFADILNDLFPNGLAEADRT